MNASAWQDDPDVVALQAFSSRFGSSQAAMTDEYSGSDPDGVVTVGILGNGTPVSVTISEGWERVVRWHQLGAAVMAARDAATFTALSELERKVEEAVDHGDELAPAQTTGVIDRSKQPITPAEVELVLAARDEQRDYLDAIEQIYSRSVSLKSADESVTVTVIGGAVKAVDFDEDRVKFSDAQSISRSALEVLVKAEQWPVAAQAELTEQFPATARLRTASEDRL